ncbi:carboxypeptidase-like regulatory domain-containing protein [uncultured Paludibaculum sp.]|uniref:carboxypeptidase-like regulatory domain-containing protein n=1 Tax=uncultured Paludibaculum sp. TaxID=1765020 RepID=UPI002AAB492F|nr:carboxypeptidase-like regulatory domain-containing protein [uncultured Paludibaculum sp.]
MKAVKRGSLAGPMSALLLFVISMPVPVAAQSTFGSVVGQVADSTGGSVPNAKVGLLEVRTHVTRQATTSPDGLYEFLNVPQGEYKIEIEMAGFKKFATATFELQARQIVRMDAGLVVGDVAATVEVAGTAPLVNTETPTVSSVRSNEQLLKGPFMYRSAATSPARVLGLFSESQLGVSEERQFSLSGGMVYQNDVSVDGILSTNIRDNGIGLRAEGLFPSTDTIQELKVSSVNNNAEFAQMGSITTITKSGTNAYHGSVLYNYYGNSMRANPSYFAKQVNNGVLPREVNNDIVGNVGGRIIPNRTFFFAAYERLTKYGLVRNSTSGITVPENDIRQGDFSRFLTTAQKIVINDPATNQPFAGNIIPASRINSVSRKIADKYIGPVNVASNLYFYLQDNAPEIQQNYDVRIDHYFGNRHNVFGRYSWKDYNRKAATNFQSEGGLQTLTPSHTMVLSDNFVIRPNLINEARFGFSLLKDVTLSGIRARDFLQDTGLKLVASNVPDISGASNVNISGYTAFGRAKDQPLVTHTYEFGDNVTWQAGHHTVKAGVQVHWLNFQQPAGGYGELGTFTFDNNLTRGTNHPFANFLLGVPTVVNQTQPGPGVNANTNHYGFFVQDEWRLRKVTVSLGLRYELHSPFEDGSGNIANFLQGSVNGDVVVPSEASRALATPRFVNAIGTAKILTAEQAGIPSRLRFTDRNNFAPRIGVAWRPFNNNKTVLRAGYGLYTVRVLGPFFTGMTDIHTSGQQIFTNTFNDATSAHSIVWPNTSNSLADLGNVAVGTLNFSSANAIRFRDPYTQQWSFTVEREVARRNSVRITYTGNHGVGLVTSPNINEVLPNTVGYNNLPASARPYPNYRQVRLRANGGSSSYHDLTIQHRLLGLGGLTVTNSYKFAKGISNVETDPNNANFSNEIPADLNNRFDPRYWRGPMVGIPYHRALTDFLWDVPLGRGRHWGRSWNRLVDGIAGGWTISSIMMFQSGPHLTPFFTSHCQAGTDCSSRNRPDVVAGQDPDTGLKTTEAWFNTGAFTKAPFLSADGKSVFAGRFGNAGVGSVTGPGIMQIDAGVFKDIRLTERWSMRVQGQARNLPNHPNFTNPNMNMDSADFGKIRGLNGNAYSRLITGGVRILF